MVLALLLAALAPGMLAAEPQATDQLIAFFQSRVARDPGDVFSSNKLGAVYVQKARESGDLTYYALAEKAARRSTQLVPQGPTAAAATTLLALVHHARHEFQEALGRAQQAVQLGGADVSPHAIAGDALVELGDYDGASRAYSRLLGLTGPRHPHGRLAYLRFLQGDAEAALAGMRRAVEAARDDPASREPLAWSQAQLGEVAFQIGRTAEADAAYGAALATYPGYHRALAGLARVRGAQHRYVDAVDLYRKALAVIPLPEYAAALGDVHAKIGQRDEARKQYALVEYIGALNALNKTVYNRELALFYADHDMKPVDALRLARKELDVRRDIYTHDVLAWALYRNGRFVEAEGAIKEALRFGTPDPRLHFHAGLIHEARGDTDGAARHLARALALNPGFHVLHAETAARTLERLRAAQR